ncbi:MAG TPA: DUF2330 domain-containing protein [Candidatus Dormibacteraeota bacterium]|nr:DUF2330 domain-containing protein [Candidatus Dormibacteraeota bacterium]
MRRRLAMALSGAALATMLVVGPTLACGGLIGPNGAVNLLRTTTLAAYHDGVEHYVTAFQFQGGGGAFGSITPLPGVPSSIEKGGDWTLQRLVREVDPPVPQAFDALRAASGAEVLMQVRIDALDITVLKGGAADVGKWAAAHGFRLPPDAPEVLDFYAKRSPIFLAAVFDADAAAARGQAIGDGTPVHVTIPTPNPWVPIRILALGKQSTDQIDADVFLLTDRAPAFLPAPTGTNGMRIDHSDAATKSLLDDLRSDRGMSWVPPSAWLTRIAVDAKASQLSYDLAIDASGQGMPSYVQAGFDAPQTIVVESATWTRLVVASILALVILILVVAFGRPRAGRLTPAG